MPNYYIQAKRGTFNPFSFDEYVKPLNMYKEYYERNEEAITDMQEQANLWKNIMESEKDSKLAEKYNTYVNNLNNATQQLKNGMSYNLRNQIQQLRGQSAMVKQIENAYNLRAKDIDAYNELMIKDPSRIGADDPTTRSLNDYLNGPVKNNYGVSGDRLFTLGAAEAKAYAARNVNFRDTIDKYGQFIERAKSQGLTNEEIGAQLENKFSDLSQMAKAIMTQEGATFDNASDYYRALAYTTNGMLSGATYDETRTYNPYGEYMTRAQLLKTLDDAKKQIDGIGDGFHLQTPGDLTLSIKSKLENPKIWSTEKKPELHANESYNVNDDIFNKKIKDFNNENSKITFDNNGNISFTALDKIFSKKVLNEDSIAGLSEEEKEKKRNAYKTHNEWVEKNKDELLSYFKGGTYNDFQKIIDFKNKLSNANDSRNKLANKSSAWIQNLWDMYRILDDVEGDTYEKKYENYVKYYDALDSEKVFGYKYYTSSSKRNNVDNIIRNEIIPNSTIRLYNSKGKIEDVSFSEKEREDFEKNATFYPSMYGIVGVYGKGDKQDVYLIDNINDVNTRKYNSIVSKLTELLNVQKAKEIYEENSKLHKNDTGWDGFVDLNENISFKITNGKMQIKDNYLSTDDFAEMNLYSMDLIKLIDFFVQSEAKRLYDTSND